MVAMQRGAVLLTLLAAMGFAGVTVKREARCIGSFPIAFHPIPVTLDSLKAAAVRTVGTGSLRKSPLSPGPGLTRVSALINDSLSLAELEGYGWRLISRIGDIVTLEGNAESARFLGALRGIRYVKMPSVVHTVMDSARRNTYVNQLQNPKPGVWSGPRLTGKHVFYGLIDTDFDTHHKAFRDSSGATRFIAVWDQLDSTKKYPNRFGYGSIANHNQLLTDSLFSLSQGFHGTCMASYAAGSQWDCPYYGVAPDATIAGVKMGNTDVTIIDGLSWLFSLADSLKLPCVISMSLGSPEGPHDGTSLVDRAIDSLSAKPGHIVVGAAGNDGDKRAHVPLGQSTGTWLSSYPYNNMYYYGIEMWGDSGKTFTVTFNILDTAAKVYRKAGSSVSTTFTGQYNDETVVWIDSTSTPIKRDTVIITGLFTEHASVLNGKPHLQAQMVAKNPSLHLGVSVTITGGGIVQAWSLYQKALNSFQISGYLGGDSTMSVNELGGTSKSNITVGAYEDHLLLTLYDGTVYGYDDLGLHSFSHYTGRGPTADGRIKPDIVAPGTGVVGAMARDMPTTNFLIAYWPDFPALDERYAYTGGTSCSAPIVAGVVALMLQAEPTLTFSQARTLIQQTATNDAATGVITTPNNLWGAGKANALGAVGKLLGISSALPIAGIHAGPSSALTRLSGNRLLFKSAMPFDRLSFEYFSVNGRLARKILLAKGATMDSYNSLPHGIYLARVRAGGVTLSEMTVTMLDRE